MTELAPDPAVPRRDALLRAADDGRGASRSACTAACRSSAASAPTSSTASATACASSTATVDGARTSPLRTRRKAAPADRRARGRRRAVPVPARPQAARAARAGARLAGARAPARRAGARRGSSPTPPSSRPPPRAVDARGRVLAYAKVQRDDGERRGCEALAGQDAVRVPRVLAARRRRARARGARRPPPRPPRRPSSSARCTRSARALAALHALGASTPRGSTRLDLARLATAAAVIARARPDVEAAAERLLARLVARARGRARAP